MVGLQRVLSVRCCVIYNHRSDLRFPRIDNCCAGFSYVSTLESTRSNSSIILSTVSIFVLFLLVILCSSVFLTSSAVSIYTFARFVILIRAHGRAGLSEWIVETKLRILSALPIVSPKLDNSEFWDHDTPGGLEIEIKHEDSEDHFSITQEIAYDEDETKVVG
jgi:hypothetical protein